MLLENIKIISVSEERTGTNEATGKPWAQRNVLLGFEDETGESYMYAQVDSEVWEKTRFRAGQVVSLHLRFRTRRFQSGWIANDIRIIDPENIQQP